MSMKIHIKNGRLIDPKNKIDRVTDLYIAAGKVVVSTKRRTAFTPIAKSMRAILSSAPA